MPAAQDPFERKTRPAVAPLLALWLFQLAAFFTPSATWSPMTRFGLTHALSETASLDLGSWAEATGDRARVGDRWLSDKAPFPALAATVPYLVTRTLHRLLGHAAPSFEAESRQGIPAVRVTLDESARQLLYASSVGVSGISFVCLGLLLRTFLLRRFSERTAFVAAACVLLGTSIYPYATSFYGHVPAAMCLLAALVLTDGRAPQPRYELAGASLVGAVGCEYIALFPALVIAIHALVAAPRGEFFLRTRRLAWGALPVAVVLLGYHQLAFGAPWRTGYSFLRDPTFVAGHQRGMMGIGLPSGEALMGLLVSPSRGLLWVAPVSLAGLVGLVLWVRAQRASDATGLAFILAFIALTLANAGYYMWWGGAAAGPRHLVPMLSVLALGVAELWQRKLGPVVIVPLAGISITVSLAFAAVGLEAPETGNLLTDFLLPRLLRGELSSLPSATNLGILLGLPRAMSLAPWLIFFVLVGRAIWRRTAPVTLSSDAEATRARDELEARSDIHSPRISSPSKH